MKEETYKPSYQKMSRTISQALNIRVVSMIKGRKAISPPGHPITVTVATYVPFARSSSSSAKPMRRTEQEERKHRENRRSHQMADILGLAWDPELEPDFRGPLWEYAAASAKNNKPEKNSGSIGSAEDASTTMEETSKKTKNSSTTSSSSPSSGNSGFSSGGLSGASGEPTSLGGSSLVSDDMEA